MLRINARVVHELHALMTPADGPLTVGAGLADAITAVQGALTMVSGASMESARAAIVGSMRDIMNWRISMTASRMSSAIILEEPMRSVQQAIHDRLTEMASKLTVGGFIGAAQIEERHEIFLANEAMSVTGDTLYRTAMQALEQAYSAVSLQMHAASYEARKKAEQIMIDAAVESYETGFARGLLIGVGLVAIPMLTYYGGRAIYRSLPTLGAHADEE